MAEKEPCPRDLSALEREAYPDVDKLRDERDPLPVRAQPAGRDRREPPRRAR